MTHRSTSALRVAVLLFLSLGLAPLPQRAAAEPVPGKNDRLVAQLVTSFLKQGHLNHPEIGDEVSRRLFKRFIKDLDPTKLYFLNDDIEEFKKHETELDDQLRAGDYSFAYKVYERLLKRVGERQPLIKELVDAPHDFTVKESLDTDFDKMPYAAGDADLRERWRKRIKFDLLLNKLDKKPLPEAEAKQKILDRYQALYKRWKQVDNYDLMEVYLSDLTMSIDPHTTYMSPSTLDDFDISMRLNLEGIGALLKSDNGQTRVAEIVPGGVAAVDGRLQPDDRIVGVAQGDGKFIDTVDMKLRDVVKMVRGARGTPVQLKVVQTGKVEPVVIDLTRKKIELQSQAARGEVVEQGKKTDGTPYRVGVLDLPSFYADPRGDQAGAGGGGKSATEDVRKILNSFKDQRVDAVVLDLRRNGGGALSEALSLTGLFIDQGPVVQIKSGGRVQVRNDPEPGTVYGGPLVALVSRFSASAAEILAGALQDYDRALVVGDVSTHGKGTVQVVVDIGAQLRQDPSPKLGALKLTIQQFYRVNGESTQNRGVMSDVVLPSLTEFAATTEQELDNAVPFDKVQPTTHTDLRLVTPELRAALKGRSADRVKKSEEFTKLIKDIDRFKDRKARKAIPLNEQELRQQFSRDDAEKAAEKNLGPEPPKSQDKKDYKFPRNYFNNEVLDIAVDLVQGKSLTAPPR